jgi:hypothetical protein
MATQTVAFAVSAGHRASALSNDNTQEEIRTMKNRLLIAAALAAATLSTSVLASDVGVSVSIGQPGFYGRLDVGGFPPPPVIYRQPVMIQPAPVGRPPLYLRVPPGHARHWREHCYRYGACGERVYFVQDNWYQHEYAPRYREHHEEWRGHHREEERGYRDGYHGGDHEHEQGHGRGHGR